MEKNQVQATKALTSKYIFDGTTIRENEVVLINEDTIIDIIPRANLQSTTTVTDFGDGIICPGFIDLQLNGCGGVLFNNAISCDTLEVMYQTWLKFGTTGFLPTLISSDFKDVVHSLQVIQQWFAQYGNTRGVLGIHLEGPFISKIKCGIHEKKYIVTPTDQLLQQIVAYRQFFPIKMTIAVEEFTQEQIQFLTANDIILAIGHSNATYAVAQQAIEWGVSSSTHMFNAMSGLTARNPGVIGAILNSNIFTGIIVDMLHVDSANIQLLERVKSGYVYLVSDAVTSAGTDIEQFDLAGKTIYVNDGKCVDENGVLGGANITLNEAIRNCVKYCNLSLSSSLAMATSIPAQVLSVDNVLGRIKNGYRADLVYLNLDDFTCKIC